MFHAQIKATLVAAAFATLGFFASAASAQPISYQGQLQDTGVPANGTYNLRFRIWDDLTPGAPDNLVSTILTIPAVVVTDGLFTVELDFGNSSFITSGERFLEIEVQPTSGGGYTTLSPRQHFTHVPKSIFAESATISSLTSAILLPITATGGDSNLNASNVLFQVNNFGTTGTAIRGDGKTAGVHGLVADFTALPITPSGIGVLGMSRFFGLYGVTQEGVAVHGESLTGTGSRFLTNSSSTTHFAVETISRRGSTAGIFEVRDLDAVGLPALIAKTDSQQQFAYAVHGLIESTSPGSFSTAVRGENRGTGFLGVGVWGSHDGAGYGVYGTSASGLAGRFDGDVFVAGNLSKSSGSFKIDHPLDPENMYLSHSFVESPDMKNIYDGVITLDEDGRATVTLPNYFNALNQEFRYQLTCVGGYAPVYIANEISEQRFTIAGGTNGLKVSWQVTGVRHDAWAEQNRIVVEEQKSSQDQGSYLNPSAFGQPSEKGIGYQHAREMKNEHSIKSESN